MATTVVFTPVKSHTGIFSTRTAGGRIALTPSPRSHTVANSLLFTPPHARRHDPDWHAEKKTGLSNSFTAAFQSLKITPVKAVPKKARSPKIVSSPKSDIAKKNTPIRLELGVSEWTLNSGSARVKRKHRPAVGKKNTIRMNGDRFIPNRAATSPTAVLKAVRITKSRPAASKRILAAKCSVLHDSAFGSGDLSAVTSEDEFLSSPNAEAVAFQASIADACGLNLNTRVLGFKPKAPQTLRPFDPRPQYNRPLRPTGAAKRRILTAPQRVLDAPGLLNDYYLNLLDWSSTNKVAIGLENEVYVWDAETGAVSTLMDTGVDTYVSSVKWSADGAFMAIGTCNGDVELWDIEEKTRIRTMKGHDSRVGVMSWNKAILSAGNQSGYIFNHDVRIAEHKVAELHSHTMEVCGLEWRSDGAMLVSGGNDNLVNIWDARLLNAPKWTKTNHKAAVKAVAWCPWQTNLLATGGGNGDGHIHFWNATTGARVKSIDAGSQVTSLKWSPNYREFVSCHGGPENQLTVWNYQKLARIIDIPAHDERILHSALSPDGQTLATCASDENLKLWKLFEKRSPAQKVPRDAGYLSGKYKQMTIR